jgi:hypothetical protein
MPPKQVKSISGIKICLHNKNAPDTACNPVRAAGTAASRRARFSSIFLASSSFRFDGESSPARQQVTRAVSHLSFNKTGCIDIIYTRDYTFM